MARVGVIALDCDDDPATLAAFWQALLDGEIVFTSDDVVAVKTDHLSLAAVRVPDYRPPTWPDSEVPKQLHLDFAVADLDAAEAAATRLGARRAETQPAPNSWRVMLDPAGHPFCLCNWGQSSQS